MNAVAATGWPMAPSSISWRQVWIPPPSTVSGAHAKLLRLGHGAAHVQVGASSNLHRVEAAEVLEIDSADIAAADDANFCFVHSGNRIEDCQAARLAHSRPRRIISRASGTSKSSGLWPSDEKNTL